MRRLSLRLFLCLSFVATAVNWTASMSVGVPTSTKTFTYSQEKEGVTVNVNVYGGSHERESNDNCSGIQNRLKAVERSLADVTNIQSSFESILVQIRSKLDNLTRTIANRENTTPVLRSCKELLQNGFTQSGVYKIDPKDGYGPFEVYCDMETNNGGWIVFQRRKDGSVDFYRNWNDYRSGFGDLSGEFWLGLDKINRLTKASPQVLRIDMSDFDGNSNYAQYGTFVVSDEASRYMMTSGHYSGDAGDSFHSGEKFSTKDKDNDSWEKSCAQTYKGAWWYGACHSSNLNGLYHKGQHESSADGINWHAWKGYNYSLKFTEMKIRPK